MKSLSNKFILSIKPKEYLHQGPSHCGAYSTKGILSAYGLDVKGHPKEYHPHIFGKVTGLTFGPHYYENILKHYGLNASRKTANKLSSEEQLPLLKTLLSSNRPVMLRIGNGYITDKYNPLVGKLQGHWITLWGYNDEKQLFYVL